MADRAVPDPLAHYLQAPLPSGRVDVGELPLLAVDFETTGLSPKEHQLLSVGWVPVDGLRIDLSGAGAYVVAATGGVGASATVHRLTDDDVARGSPLEEVVGALLDALAGRALLAHFAQIETGFLSAACERLWGVTPPYVVIDTMTLERGLVSDAFRPDARTGELRLWAARERYGLPPYRAHEALTDALACAELYLAQAAELDRYGPVTLRRLTRR